MSHAWFSCFTVNEGLMVGGEHLPSRRQQGQFESKQASKHCEEPETAIIVMHA